MTHDHSPSDRAGRRHLRPLLVAFALVIGFVAVEVAAAFWTGSLALLADAGHMATDGLGLGMAVAAIVAADRAGRGGTRTFGLYRLEILAALANAALLFGIGGFVLWEAVTRLDDPPEILSTPMLAVAVAGLAVNMVAWYLLRDGARESLNVEGAFLEVLADTVGSVGVILAALLVRFGGWDLADPIVAAAIGLFILPRAWRLAGKAFRILVQAAPAGLDIDELGRRLADLPGVVDVHDLHVWTLTSQMDVATAHLMVATETEMHPVLDGARTVLEEEYGIRHATLQVEPDTHEGCAEVSW